MGKVEWEGTEVVCYSLLVAVWTRVTPLLERRDAFPFSIFLSAVHLVKRSSISFWASAVHYEDFVLTFKLGKTKIFSKLPAISMLDSLLRSFWKTTFRQFLILYEPIQPGILILAKKSNSLGSESSEVQGTLSLLNLPYSITGTHPLVLLTTRYDHFGFCLPLLLIL